MSDFKKEYKAKAMASVNALREVASVKELALELYQLYELQSPVQSWIAHMGACFNPEKPEFFHWCDIVAMMKITGNYEPLFFVCDELGLSHPDPVDPKAEADQLQFSIKQLEREIAEKRERLDLLGKRAGNTTRFSRS